MSGVFGKAAEPDFDILTFSLTFFGKGYHLAKAKCVGGMRSGFLARSFESFLKHANKIWAAEVGLVHLFRC